MRSPSQVLRGRSPARIRISLRAWALLTVAVVAVVGSIYGAGSGARRSIHATAAPGAAPSAPVRLAPGIAALQSLPVSSAVADILPPGTQKTFRHARH